MRFLVLALLGLLAFFLLGGLSGCIEGFEGTEAQRCGYLETMVKYLTVVIRMQEARKELYLPGPGFGSPPATFSSPKLIALEKQRQFIISEVKKDPQKLAFFRENLTLPL